MGDGWRKNSKDDIGQILSRKNIEKIVEPKYILEVYSAFFNHLAVKNK